MSTHPEVDGIVCVIAAWFVLYQYHFFRFKADIVHFSLLVSLQIRVTRAQIALSSSYIMNIIYLTLDLLLSL